MTLPTYTLSVPDVCFGSSHLWPAEAPAVLASRVALYNGSAAHRLNVERVDIRPKTNMSGTNSRKPLRHRLAVISSPTIYGGDVVAGVACDSNAPLDAAVTCLKNAYVVYSESNVCMNVQVHYAGGPSLSALVMSPVLNNPSVLYRSDKDGSPIRLREGEALAIIGYPPIDISGAVQAVNGAHGPYTVECQVRNAANKVTVYYATGAMITPHTAALVLHNGSGSGEVIEVIRVDLIAEVASGTIATNESLVTWAQICRVSGAPRIGQFGADCTDKIMGADTDRPLAQGVMAACGLLPIPPGDAGHAHSDQLSQYQITSVLQAGGIARIATQFREIALPGVWEYRRLILSHLNASTFPFENVMSGVRPPLARSSNVPAVMSLAPQQQMYIGQFPRAMNTNYGSSTVYDTGSLAVFDVDITFTVQPVRRAPSGRAA